MLDSSISMNIIILMATALTNTMATIERMMVDGGNAMVV